MAVTPVKPEPVIATVVGTLRLKLFGVTAVSAGSGRIFMNSEVMPVVLVPSVPVTDRK